MARMLLVSLLVELPGFTQLQSGVEKVDHLPLVAGIEEPA